MLGCLELGLKGVPSLPSAGQELNSSEKKLGFLGGAFDVKTADRVSVLRCRTVGGHILDPTSLSLEAPQQVWSYPGRWVGCCLRFGRDALIWLVDAHMIRCAPMYPTALDSKIVKPV